MKLFRTHKAMTSKAPIVSILLLAFCGLSLSLDNGLARTPPMGWLAWERFRCNIDCDNDPENCISEHLFKVTADKMVEDGYLDAGYEYLILDDCWPAKDRDENGRLYADPKRFPSGIKGLSDYVHSKGLKFGIYEDYGTYTCAGYPGIIDHMETDAQTFADWEVDYVKLDGCYAEPEIMDEGYPKFGQFLNATGRPMVYSCSWPCYQTYSGMKPNFTAIAESCNLWRNWGDIDDSWDSVQSIMDYFASEQEVIVPHAGPGHWNDPDMLIMGNFGLSYEQSKSQMGIWAILAAPMIMSVDLRTIKPEFADIYKNKGILAISQDALGIQGKRLFKEDNLEKWVRPISPSYDEQHSYAVALLNRRTDGIPRTMSFVLKELGLESPQGYKVQDAFTGEDLGEFKPEDTFSASVNPTGIVLVRCEVNKPTKLQDRHRPATSRISSLNMIQDEEPKQSHGSLKRVGNYYVRDFVKV